MSDFYNEVIKNRYLNEIENEDSRNTIKYIFLASKRAEEIKGMDLYNFSKEDIELVLGNMTIISNHTARANVNYITNYISWCIGHGYRENNLNPLDTVDRKWISGFVDRTIKIHYTDEELDDLIEEFDNAQDQAMVQLWFEGVIGQDFSEIKELNYYDIDWINNKLEVREKDGSKRKVTVSDKCMRYLQNAHHQRTYIFNTVKDGEIYVTERELFNTNFIFKNVISYRSKEEGVGSSVIYTRLKALKDRFNLEYLTPNAIKQSGMIYMAAELFKRDGELKTKQLNEIGEKYNWSKVNNNGYEYYNVTLMKYFITRENLKNLYDLDVDIEIKSIKRK